MPSTAEAPQRTNTDLLNLIRSRGEKQTKFGQGILTADRWVKNLRDEVGLDICYQMAAKGTVSFDDVLRKSAETLTYNNPDMVVQGKMHDFGSIQTELPKNTLMVFQHVLTTPRKDRDGDILRTEGANVDPRMLLLWQHVHTLPIGKMLGVVEHTKDRLSLLSALVDINSLAHDAAVMVDNDMARFSHGFQARDWAPLEEKEGEFPGFEVREFDIMEESIVSIPSNADADMQEVFLSLVENGKLTSPLCKEQGRQIRKSRPVAVALGVSLKEKIDENKSADRSDETGEGEGVGDPSPKETKEVAGEKAETGSAEVAEVSRRRVSPLETKRFDVELEHLEASKLEYEWASRWLGCQVKEMEVVDSYVPGYRKGSFLTGMKGITSQWELRDTRNLTRSGKEEPPFYEVVELNSRLSDTFLISGMEFYKTDKGTNVCVKVSPTYGGVYITTYVKRGDATGGSLIDKSWEWAIENNFLKGEAFKLSGGFIKRGSTTLDDVFLTPKNKNALVRTVKRINDKGRSAENRGIVMLGKPGTGKTLSGRVVLNEAKASFIWVSAKDFWKMGTVGGLCAAFSLANELSPAVIFVEDIDNWMSDYAVDVIKTEMDGIEKSSGVTTILTTNYPERFPDALIDRPGRFHEVLLIDLPDDKVRAEMIQKWSGTDDSKVIKKMVAKTKGYSGAHIYELVQLAKSLQDEEEELAIGEALEKAAASIDQQRELITNAQLAGSNYRPHKACSYLKHVGKPMISARGVVSEKIEDDPAEEPVTAQKTMAIFLEIASPEDRQKMLSILQALKQADDLEAKQKQFREFVRSDA